MRVICFLVTLGLLTGPAMANRLLSGVVAVSTGPLQAKYTAAPDAIGRNLSAGDEVYMNDEVATGVATRAQVLLRDESVFSLGPKSKVVFDAFIYDPSAREGALEVSLMTGGMRFVSGQIANRQPQNVRIKAGSATVGIRGTEIMAKHGDAGSTFILLSGAMEVATEDGVTLIDRPGFGIDVSADGALGDIRRVSVDEINQILAPPPAADDAASKTNEEETGEEASAEDETGEEASEEVSEESSAAETGEAEQAESAAPAADAKKSDAGGNSSFDRTLMQATQNQGDAADAEITGLSDVAAAFSASGDSESAANSETKLDAEAEAKAELNTEANTEAKPEETPQGRQEDAPAMADPMARAADGFSSEDALSSVIDALAEDRKNEKATQIAAGEDASDIGAQFTLSLNSTATLTTRPYLSSTGKILIRAQSAYTNDAFDMTRTLLREKFPESDVNGAGTKGFVHTDSLSADALNAYDAVLFSISNNYGPTVSEVTTARDYIAAGHKVLVIGRSNNASNSDSIPGVDFLTLGLRFFFPDAETPTVDVFSTDSGMAEPLVVKSDSDSVLLDGVTSFNGYFNSNAFRPIDMKYTPPSLSQTAVPGGLLTVDTKIQAADFGDKGAMYINRYPCRAGAPGGELGASVNFNAVSDGRLQFCRNLISSLAPADSLVDVEIGTLSVSDGAQNASYRLIGGGNNNFKLIGNRLILDKAATLEAGSYDLTIGVTPTGGVEQEKTIAVAVAAGTAETRVIASRQTHVVGEAVSFSTENLMNSTDDLNAISWVSISGDAGSGSPSQTGVITLHYRNTESGRTYDRFHEIEIVPDCSSDHCGQFATSMDTENELTFNEHFSEDDFTLWSSFFTRFTSGTGRFASRRYEQTTPFAASYEHNLTINYGSRSGTLETDGQLPGVVVDETWSVDFLAAGGACESRICSFQDSSADYDLSVNLAAISLPNGKHALMVKSSVNPTGMEASPFSQAYEPMTPQ